MQNLLASSVFWKGFIYGFDGDKSSKGTLKCLEAATGAEKWARDGLGKGTLIIADGKLIVLSERGELLVAPALPSGFRPLARARVLSGQCWAAPVLCRGLIYARTVPGDLVCLDVRG